MNLRIVVKNSLGKLLLNFKRFSYRFLIDPRGTEILRESSEKSSNEMKIKVGTFFKTASKNSIKICFRDNRKNTYNIYVDICKYMLIRSLTILNYALCVS